MQFNQTVKWYYLQSIEIVCAVRSIACLLANLLALCVCMFICLCVLVFFFASALTCIIMCNVIFACGFVNKTLSLNNFYYISIVGPKRRSFVFLIDTFSFRVWYGSASNMSIYDRHSFHFCKHTHTQRERQTHSHYILTFILNWCIFLSVIIQLLDAHYDTLLDDHCNTMTSFSLRILSLFHRLLYTYERKTSKLNLEPRAKIDSSE